MGRLAGAARADMSVDGTRFVYPAREKAISVYVGNIGAEPILVQSWLDRGEARDANDLARLKVPFVLTPPLLRLEPNERKAVQLPIPASPCPRSRVPVLGEFPGSAGRKRRAEQPAPATEPVDEGLVPARGPGKAQRCAGKLRWTWRDAGNGSMRVGGKPHSLQRHVPDAESARQPGDGLAGLTVPPLSSASFVGRWPRRAIRAGCRWIMSRWTTLGCSAAAPRPSSRASIERHRLASWPAGHS